MSKIIKELLFINKVVDSCKTKEQLKTCHEWFWKYYKKNKDEIHKNYLYLVDDITRKLYRDLP